jgi:hypothetical protein
LLTHKRRSHRRETNPNRQSNPTATVISAAVIARPAISQNADMAGTIVPIVIKESDNHSPLLRDENWDAYFDSWRTKTKSV